MSRTKVPHPGDIYGQARAHLAELRATYPSQFCPDDIGDLIHRSWPDGWHSLVASVCDFAAKHYPDVQWGQIGEKYGGLRMYFGGANIRVNLHMRAGLLSFEIDNNEGKPLPELQELINRTEALSMKTCALCGVQDGAERHVERRNLGGWLLATCDECVPLINAYQALPFAQR
ncbi:MAG: hypothetical protein M3O62_06195 [Pseudomonadota bacterium]|nr:hypothetical protein [Pseudomonadota bacterium]